MHPPIASLLHLPLSYVIYNAHIQGGNPPYHLMSVDKLTPDYTASAGVTSGYFGASNVEVGQSQG
jgi:hypothetical protein